MRTTRLLLPVVAVAVLLAGCSGDDPAPERDDTPAGPTKTERAEPADEPGEDPAGAGDLGDLAACMLGEWDVDLQAQAAVSRAALASSLPGTTVTATGTSTIEVTDGTLTTHLDGVEMTMVLAVEGQEVAVVMTMDGSTSQEFTLDGDTIVTTGVEQSGLRYDARTFVAGVETELPGFAEGMQQGMNLQGATGSTSRVVCGPDEMQVIPLVAGTEIPDMTQVYRR